MASSTKGHILQDLRALFLVFTAIHVSVILWVFIRLQNYYAQSFQSNAVNDLIFYTVSVFCIVYVLVGIILSFIKSAEWRNKGFGKYHIYSTQGVRPDVVGTTIVGSLGYFLLFAEWCLKRWPPSEEELNRKSSLSPWVWGTILALVLVIGTIVILSASPNSSGY